MASKAERNILQKNLYQNLAKSSNLEPKLDPSMKSKILYMAYN
jgi:hypothetical protein